jgi:hypothetical protein
MTCEEFWEFMPELEGAVEHEHVRGCAACGTRLNRQKALRQGLGQLAQDFQQEEAPHRVESKLLRTFREQHQGIPAPRRHKVRLVWGLAAAAAIGLFFLTTLERHSTTNPPYRPAGIAEAIQTDGAEQFWPLPNASGVSAEDADLVTVEVPTATLAAMGVPVSEDGPARVQAVLALDADGVVQGVRLLQ